MSSIPILSGIFTDEAPDLRTSYPVNMVPVPKSSGISEGYLRPADGIVPFATGPGFDRGGINWNGSCYRVMGDKLVRVDADRTVHTLGVVGSGGPVTLDYWFERLAVASASGLYYWDGATLTQVTDPDLGVVVDMIQIGGYSMTTDGEFLVVTDLNDPLAVNPLKYGSSEADPDPIKGLLRFFDQAAALNRHTIEFFRNVGGNFFPFQRIEGAMVNKGTIGTHTKCLLGDTIVFMGGGRGESISVHAAVAGNSTRIATREIDTLLHGYTEVELASAVMESRVDKGHQHVLIHLPDRTLAYDAAASKVVEQPVWFTLTSALQGFEPYRARHAVRCYDMWLVGDTESNRIGSLTPDTSSHWEETVRWEFGTVIVYNAGKGAIFHELELVCLTGRVENGKNPTISTSYSVDGVTWSQDKFIRAGAIGDRLKRLVWLQQGHMRHWRIQRFRGDSQAHIAPIRLEATLEALAA